MEALPQGIKVAMADGPSVEGGRVPYSRGLAVERRVREIAAVLGVPEFVYSAPLISKGSSVREVGDGIIYCGAGGAILQVKARSYREGLRDSGAAATGWINKNVTKAIRQGRGSKRTIAAFRDADQPLPAVPVRALVLGSAQREVLEVTLDVDSSQWPTIIVVDHPRAPEVLLPSYADAFCITLDDWRGLNYHLRSIHELLRYVSAVLECGADVAVPLGREFARFASMAEHDQAYAAQAKGAIGWTSFAAADDPIGVNSYRQLLDRTWGENEILPGLPIRDYRPVLDFLDNVPAAGQAYAGRWIMSKRQELLSCRHRTSGSVLLVDRPLVYMCDFKENQPDRKAWVAQLAGLTSLRAVEWREQGRGRKPVLGIGVRVFADGDDEYSYYLAHEPMKMPPELRSAFEWSFGVANFKTFHTNSVKVGRNESCPCGSTLKYKRCHGISGRSGARG